MQMQKRLILLIVMLSLVIFSGCPRQQPAEPEPQVITENVQLFYGDEGNERIVSEERQVRYREGEDKYQAVLEELIKGPETEGYQATIQPDTRVYGTIKQNNALIINLSEEFQQFGGSVAEVVAVGSIANTLTQFEEIEQVKILVEGNELIAPSGEPYGFIGPFNAEPPTEPPPSATVEEVLLYFANQDASAVVPETRSVEFPAGTGLAEQLKIVTEELIRGPQREDLSATIPVETRVLGVSMTNNIAVVSFSREIETQHTGGAAGEIMTVASIVNTLTEFEGVELVELLVDGAPMNIDQMVLDAPVERSEDLIQR